MRSPGTILLVMAAVVAAALPTPAVADDDGHETSRVLEIVRSGRGVLLDLNGALAPPLLADMDEDPEAPRASVPEAEPDRPAPAPVAPEVEEERAALEANNGVVVADLGDPEAIGPYRLWLASYRTVREAQAGWRTLASEHDDILGGLTAIIVLKQLGIGDGDFFRLQAGPLPDAGTAAERCRGLEERGLFCVALGPDER